MDEFYEIRVSGLKAKAQSAASIEGADGLIPQAVLDEISQQTHQLRLDAEAILGAMLIVTGNHGIETHQRKD